MNTSLSKQKESLTYIIYRQLRTRGWYKQVYRTGKQVRSSETRIRAANLSSVRVLAQLSTVTCRTRISVSRRVAYGYGRPDT